MKQKYLSLIVASLALMASACSSMKPNAPTNYVAPSTGQVRQNVTNAQEHATSIGKHADKTSAGLTAAAAKAKTAKERIIVIQKAVAEQPAILTLAKQVEGDLDDLTKILLETTTENDALKEDVQKLQSTLTTAQTNITTLQNKVSEQTTLLNTANTERNAAITQSTIDKGNAHKFKAIIIGVVTLAVLAILFGVFKFAMFAPPILWVTIAAPSAVGIFLFFWLGSG